MIFKNRHTLKLNKFLIRTSTIFLLHYMKEKVRNTARRGSDSGGVDECTVGIGFLVRLRFVFYI